MQNIQPVIGHKKIKDFLQRSIKNNKLAHAYLFYGPSKVGKFKMALEFAKSLECRNKGLMNEFTPCNKCQSCLDIEKLNCPDVLIIRAQEIKKDKKAYEKKIGIEEIQQIQHYLSLFSYNAPYKIVIMDGAEKMSREAANSFLKTLEEPSKKSIIILVTDAIGSILPTIISRTQPVKFLSVANEELIKYADNLRFDNKIKIGEIINFSMGKPGMFIDILNDPSAFLDKQKTAEKISELIHSDTSARFDYAADISKNSKETKEIINDWMLFFRDILLLKKNCAEYLIFKNKLDILKKCSARYTALQLNRLLGDIKETQKIISNSAFNTKLILETLFLKI